MGKDIGQIYKHGQLQISTSSIKAPVSSSSEPQTSSAIELTKTYLPSIIDKQQNSYVLYSKKTSQDYATVKNNDDIQSCETQQKKL